LICLLNAYLSLTKMFRSDKCQKNSNTCCVDSMFISTKGVAMAQSKQVWWKLTF